MPKIPESNNNVPQTPNPIPDITSLAHVVIALKQGLDSLGGHRGGLLDRAVTFGDLVNIGIADTLTLQSDRGQVDFPHITDLADIATTGSASDLVAGIVPPVRVTGSYTGVIGVGVLTAGTWRADPVETPYGGTGQINYTDGQLLIGDTVGNTLVKASLTAPATGLTITGGAGSITFALANDLAALEGLGSTGFATRTAADTWAQRTLTAPVAGFTINNPAGVAGDPTFVLANDLAALEAMSGTGLVVRTSSETYAQRTITGTSNRLSASNGDGVAGNPTLDIDAAYVGQASITTLGTITTGTWNGGVIAGQYGGTGIANTGKTITLGGSLVTSGAFDTTLTVSAATDATFPAGTHTLAGLDVAQTWSADQQFNSDNFKLKGATSGTLTVNAAAIAGANILTLPAGTTDFSATGGAGQVVKQASAGGALTVATVDASELAGLGTGVATALGVNVGSAGAFVTFNGALGTPSSGTLTNATGLPVSTGISGLGTGVATFLGTPSSANLLAALTTKTGTGLAVFGTGPTLTDPILSGTVTGTYTLGGTPTLGAALALPGGGQISAIGELSLGAPANGRFSIGGIYTTTGSRLVEVAGTLASSVTSAQLGMVLNFAFSPTGASLSQTFSLSSNASLNSSTLNVSAFNSVISGVTLGSGYSGVLTNAYNYVAASPIVNGGSITNATQYHTIALTTNNGITSGSATNTSFFGAAITAAAGVGGTLTNTSAKFFVPSGSSVGNTNRGLWITGNGGPASTNWSIYNDSTADTYLSAGKVGIKNATPQADLQIGTTAGTARSYNSFTDASNGEWAYLGDWGFLANHAAFGTSKNGTGTARPTILVAGGVVGLRMTGTTRLLILGDGATTTTSYPALKRSSAILQARFGDDSDYTAFEADTLRTAKARTVAQLPAAGTAGRRAYVTDALAPAFLAAVVGGGAVVTPVFDDGTNWIAY